MINVDDAQELMMKKYSDFFSSVHLIILDNTPQALLGSINKMEVVEDLLVMLDVEIARSVFVFDRNGSFIRKIGSFGQGPGEYLGVYDFTFDEGHNNIMLLDSWSQKIHVYHLQTGDYARSITLKGDDQECIFPFKNNRLSKRKSILKLNISFIRSIIRKTENNWGRMSCPNILPFLVTASSRYYS